MRKMRKQIQLDIKPGDVLRRFSPQEAHGLADQWLQIFAASGGVPTKQFMWHVFSFDVYEHVAKHEARSATAI